MFLAVTKQKSKGVIEESSIKLWWSLGVTVWYTHQQINQQNGFDSPIYTVKKIFSFCHITLHDNESQKQDFNAGQHVQMRRRPLQDTNFEIVFTATDSSRNVPKWHSSHWQHMLWWNLDDRIIILGSVGQWKRICWRNYLDDIIRSMASSKDGISSRVSS